MGTPVQNHSTASEAQGQTNGAASGVHATVSASAFDAEEITARGRQADELAFRQLFRRYRHEVARLAYVLVGRDDDLEDIVQEVFVCIHECFHRGEVDFMTLLQRVSVDVAIRRDGAASSVAETGLEADKTSSRFLRSRAFRLLVHRLPEKRRVTFLLHEVHGLSSAEIARIVGTSVLAVHARLLSARRELARMLQEEPSLAEFAKIFQEQEPTDIRESR
jgi:RNA polymerase sigma-70 factor (ECF subfamily)